KAKPFLWVHDLWPESVKAAGGINNKIILSLINFMTKSIYYFYDNILVQSPYFKDYLVNQGVNSEKIIYYPYYAESFYKVVDKNEKIESMFPKGLNIVFAGNIGVAQSFDTIIDAVKIALNDIKSLNVIVLGEGRDKARILKKIKENDLNNFYFMGSFPPENMPEYFASADALLVSLKKSKIFSSTIPGKLQSYLACGKPVIASLDGIGAKIVNDASCGYSSDAEDFQGLAQSIIAFSKLKDVDRLKLGENGRKYYENEFERKKLLSKLIDIFEK
nr:glycosyltransferase family 4 protein [Pelagibacteraceae bacterium]